MMIALPEDISIRKMVIEDVDAVHELDERSFSAPWAKRSFVFEMKENEASRAWVAEKKDDQSKMLVGTILCWFLIDEIHIATIAVDESHKRKNVASALLYWAIRSMMEEGAVSATLDVREGNLPAQALYQKFGFELVGRRPGYYKNNSEAALLMTLHKLDEKTLSKIRLAE